MIIEEKVPLCSGFGPWSTKIERLGIEPIFLSDDPHGPRWMNPQSYTQRAQWDMSSLASLTTKSGYLDLLHPVPNFPPMATLGSSWNRDIHLTPHTFSEVALTGKDWYGMTTEDGELDNIKTSGPRSEE